jgi:hypothetical protein
MVVRAGFEPAYGKPGQIYSLLPLTTRPPHHEARPGQDGGAFWQARQMTAQANAVNLGDIGMIQAERNVAPSLGRELRALQFQTCPRQV